MSTHRPDWFSPRKMLPMLLAAIGGFFLVGCFYLPFPEHKLDSTQKDFRPLLGKDTGATHFFLGVTTKQAVIAMLGPPQFASENGKAIGYVVDTSEGLYVWPLCFRVLSGQTNSYAVRFDFDENDRLAQLKTDQEREQPFPMDPEDYSSTGTAMHLLERLTPEMHSTK